MSINLSHTQQEINNYPSHLSVCLSVCPYPPVCLCMSVSLSAAFPLYHWAIERRRKLTIIPSLRLVCIEAAGKNQWLSFKCPNGCVVCVGMYTRVYSRCCVECVVEVEAVNMSIGWGVRGILCVKCVLVLGARFSLETRTVILEFTL